MSGDYTPNDWQELEPLIDRVLDAAPDRRAALIAELSGGDPERRAELERLVEECEREHPLLDRPVAERFAALLEDDAMRVPEVVAERYRITRELGRGGMAVVYLAHDIKHDREVAVKIVRPEVAATLGRTRFLREIAIAAKLKHPHIVPLFDSGEMEGLLYYVMPYQEEQSLRERLKRDGRLPVDDTIAILSDVCDALAYAHQQGVVHRDIKPDNILLSGRHALVTDFGVARAVTAASDQDTLTTAGGVVGTAAYMAPEQESNAAVDHRVDIYAVGVMAYEMLAGERPFSGDTPPSQRTAHSQRASVDLTRLRNEVPPALAALVMKCLATEPADRYQSGAELLDSLEGLGSQSRDRLAAAVSWRSWISRAAIVAGAASVAALVWIRWPAGPRAARVQTPPRLAVLVFQHDRNDALEPLAMGLTENLINALGDVPALVVRSLNAVLPYRDGRMPPDSLGRRLDVSWLVSGRVYRLGEQTIASVQLTEAHSGRLLARSEARAPAGEDVRLIEDLVPKVAAMLRERAGDEVRVQGWRAGTRSDEAFASVNRAYKEARDANALSAARALASARLGFRRADSLLERASRADPRWVEPHIQRAWIARNEASALFGIGTDPGTIAATLGKGVEHAEAALRLRPGDPRAFEARGMLLYTKALLGAAKDSVAALRTGAEALLRQATYGDSTLVRALTTLAGIHFSRGDYEQAYVIAERAYAADAFYEHPQQAIARLFTYTFEAHEDVRARRWCTAYAESNPDDWFIGYCRLMLMIWDLSQPANTDTAWQVAYAATAVAPKVIRASIAAQLETLVAGVLARNGQAGQAQRLLETIRKRIQAEPSIAREPFGTELLDIEASVRLRLGQHDAARSLLQQYLTRHPERTAQLGRSRRFAGLRVNPPPNSKDGAR